MTLRSFLIGSALALTSASALLVVPEVDADAFSIDDIARLQPLEAQAAQQQQVDLLCTGCPFAEQSGDETSLSLEFTIDDGVLLANDHQIFPPGPPSQISAVQRRVQDGEESEPVPLGYAVEMMPIPSPPDEPFDMVEVRFTVLDLDGYPVPLDTVAVTLVHNSEGDLYMVGTSIEETADRESWRQCGGNARCLRRFLVHRIRTMFAAAKERLIGMFKGQGCADAAAPPPPFPSHGDFDRHVSEGEPHRHHGHHGPHPPPHFHDKFHKTWERTLHRVVRFIVVPAILGVLAGLAASAVGMLIGQLAVFLWQRHRRSSRKENNEEGSVSEKQGLMTESSDELPPAYTDEEAAAEQVADKA
ncbi:uncharacterized protein DSM5745_06926 [Aspergillus mulundensis]|uniref:DUF7728 domain-containing protein n=1 Tax=Aspergillus mulundensis TaxID=1810919 RepID=A0A3D8RK36_9EURO|nr:Uncharacterized protein DSM5745_06926 [Aspergillus mulundensis]RDW74264.1 Uncharacterized protein DSM5745_06926 [Aspergillus mulundensis]